MKVTIVVVLTVLVIGAVAAVLFMRSSGGVQQPGVSGDRLSLYDLTTHTLEGDSISLGAYRGQVALVVNVASKCGLTPQYEELEALYRELAPQGFVVLGFPSNDFMNQEPGTAAEIRGFCTSNYGVTFPLFEKMVVKGDGKSEIYRLLSTGLDEPSWNFTKYLVDRQGEVRFRFGPRAEPDDPELRGWIDALLAAGDV